MADILSFLSSVDVSEKNSDSQLSTHSITFSIRHGAKSKSESMSNPLVVLVSFSALLFVCIVFGTTVEAFSLETTREQLTRDAHSLRSLRAMEPQSSRCHRKCYRTRKTRREATSRREFFGVASTMAIGGTTTMMTSPSPVLAAAPSAIFSDKNLSTEDAKIRFQGARKDLKYLLDNYAEISNSGGGDAVRNYLGTQGVNSNLYGIQKVLKLLTEESDDMVEYSEAMEEFNAYYFQAEGAAYQSLFAEHSSAKATPESCLATAKQDIVQMQKYMDQLAQQLNL